MKIRFYQTKDHSALMDLWQEMDLLSSQLPLSSEILSMATNQSSVLFVGFKDDELIGTIMAADNGHRGWIEKMIVRKPHQGMGYGEELLKCAERWMLARNLSIAHLIIPEKNREAEGFFETCGYEKSGEQYFSRRLDKAACDFSKAELDVIVTYLEMLDPPSRPSISMPLGSYSLLKLNQPSVGFYRHLYTSVGVPWFWIERQKMSDDDIRDNILDENVEIFVLYGDGHPAGFIELDFRLSPKVNIAYFGLLPQWIGRGLGKYLLNWGIDYAWQKGAKQLTVDTCTLDHPRALAEYQKAGFIPYKRLHKKIVDPRLEGFIPRHLEPRLPHNLMMQDLA